MPQAMLTDAAIRREWELSAALATAALVRGNGRLRTLNLDECDEWLDKWNVRRPETWTAQHRPVQ